MSVKRSVARPRAKPDPRDGWRQSTILVHGGDAPDLNAGSVVAPIYQTTTFRFPAQYSEAATGGKVHLYSRILNPNQTYAAEVIRRLEGAEAARVFSSGMAAMTSALLPFLSAGDEIVAPDDLYGSTLTLLRGEFPRWGIGVRWVSTSDDVADAVTPWTKVVLTETPTNPTLHVYDLARWAKAARRVGAMFVVDNTFANPINQSPIEFGADLVMHSATKSIGGHADVTAGALAGRSELFAKIDPFALQMGGALDPHAAFLLSRGMKTLGLRARQQNENSRAVVSELSGHAKIVRINYPGSLSREDAAIAKRQMRGPTGMVSIVVRGGLAGAHRFMKGFKIVQVASSLGSVESLASMPADTSHRQLSRPEREARGIDDGMVRISLGIEDPADLVADLRDALRGV